MNDLQIYENPEFGKIRVTVDEDGQPLFVAADVCRALDVKNNRDALGRLDEDEKGVVSTDTPGGAQQMTAVTEAGLYVLVLGSRKPEARAFKRWVTHEVLPAIRKHGGYLTPEKLSETLLNPDVLIQLATNLKEEQERSKRMRDLAALYAWELSAAIPKVEYFDALVEKNLLCSIRETAKLLGMPEKTFTRWLMDKHFLYRSKGGKLLPYASCEPGLFAVKECGDPNSKWFGPMTFITPRGRETFRLLLQKGIERTLSISMPGQN